jgi:hypothetical protein
MIKLDKENFKIETDCKTVGEFMTEAAAIFGGNVTVIVDGCRYEFHDSPKIRVTDDKPLGSVAVERSDSLLSGVTVLRVTTAPKPETVKKSGWIQLYKDSRGYFAGYVRENKEDFKKEIGYNCDKVATVRVEWEEVVK